MAPSDEDAALALANASLRRRQAELAKAIERTRPKSVAQTLAGVGRCARCGRQVRHVGVCADCARQVRVDAIAEAVAPALGSIPSAYDARWGEAELLRRVPSLRKHRAGPEAFLLRPVLLLWGESGAGKSSLASAVYRQTVERLAEDAVEANQDAVDFASRARWVEARDVPGDGFTLALRASVLVIDDIGQEGGAGESFMSQDRLRSMADLLDKLYTHRVFKKKTIGRIILTTYGTPETWRKWYGAGIARRYWEDAEHVKKVGLDR